MPLTTTLPLRIRYNYELLLKEQMLDYGIIVVCGRQGAGKTSFITALMSLDYKFHVATRIEQAQAHIGRLRYAIMVSRGFTDPKTGKYILGNLTEKEDENLRLTPDPETGKPIPPYYSTENLCLKKTLKTANRLQKPSFISIDDLALPKDEDDDVQRYPYGSVVFVSELDKWLDTHDWQQVDRLFTNLMKYVRHDHMTLIIDIQVFDRLPIQVRKLTTDLIYILESSYEPARFFGLVKQRTHWRWFWSIPQIIEASKALAEFGVDIPKKEMFCTGGMTYKGNIYQQYNSFEAEAYFLLGVEKHGYAAREFPNMDFSPEGIREYCKAVPIMKDKESNTT